MSGITFDNGTTPIYEGGCIKCGAVSRLDSKELAKELHANNIPLLAVPCSKCMSGRVYFKEKHCNQGRESV